jgi:hypothetical protein
MCCSPCARVLVHCHLSAIPPSPFLSFATHLSGPDAPSRNAEIAWPECRPVSTASRRDADSHTFGVCVVSLSCCSTLCHSLPFSLFFTPREKRVDTVDTSTQTQRPQVVIWQLGVDTGSSIRDALPETASKGVPQITILPHFDIEPTVLKLHVEDIPGRS